MTNTELFRMASRIFRKMNEFHLKTPTYELYARLDVLQMKIMVIQRILTRRGLLSWDMLLSQPQLPDNTVKALRYKYDEYRRFLSYL